MKLKCEMQRLVTITAPMGTDDDLFHDAACAHALMLSLHQLDAGPRKWAEDGASELLREWGFDSGEVE